MHQQGQYPTGVQSLSIVDPYVVQAAQSLLGKVAVIETVRNTQRGKLVDVKPDHIVAQIGDELFFIRIQMIVSIMPD